MIIQIINDCLIYIVFLAIFSYSIRSNKRENLSWSNSLIFICYAPTLFVYLLYLVMFRSSKQNRINNLNGLMDNIFFGMITSGLSLVISYILIYNHVSFLVILVINLLLLLIYLFLYFNLKIYNFKSLIL